MGAYGAGGLFSELWEKARSSSERVSAYIMVKMKYYAWVPIMSLLLVQTCNFTGTRAVSTTSCNIVDEVFFQAIVFVINK